MKTKKNVSIDSELMETIKAMAEEEGRNVSNMMEYLIRQGLKAVRDKK